MTKKSFKKIKCVCLPVIPVLVITLLSGCTGGTSDPSITASPYAKVLYLNEIMANNDATITDPDGNGGYPDWFEVYNSGKEAIDLGGMSVTNDSSQPTQWQIPAGVRIEAGGYLLFWADKDETQGKTHTNFKLNKAGGGLGLYDTDANGNAPIDTLTYGNQKSDISLGRYPDGGTSWSQLTKPTPGQSNQAP
jgi:hypothetical protein